MIIHLVNLAALTYSSFQDFRLEKFNFLIPLAAVIYTLFTGVDLNIFYFFTFLLVLGIAWKLKYIRFGDIIPLSLYMLPFTSLQATFTLLTGIGLYLYSYPKIFEEKKWVPLIPGITLCYLIQLLLF